MCSLQRTHRSHHRNKCKLPWHMARSFMAQSSTLSPCHEGSWWGFPNFSFSSVKWGSQDLPLGLLAGWNTWSRPLVQCLGHMECTTNRRSYHERWMQGNTMSRATSCEPRRTGLVRLRRQHPWKSLKRKSLAEGTIRGPSTFTSQGHHEYLTFPHEQYGPRCLKQGINKTKFKF